MERGEAAATLYDLLSDRSYGFLAAARELKAPASLTRQLALELESLQLTPEQQLLTRQIILTSERALRLTSNLTKASQLTPEVNEQLFALEPLNAQQLCEEVAHELTPLYEAAGRHIHVQTRRQAPLVVANRELLRRILLGFGDNALQYSGHDRPAVFGVSKVGETVQVGLRDTGPVLSAAFLRKLFASQDTTSIVGRPQGSGLGLTLAARFAQAMHAGIGTERHRDGMTFYVAMAPSVQLSLL